MTNKQNKFLNYEDHFESVKELSKTKNLTEIGTILGCSATTVSEFTRKYSIFTPYGYSKRLLEDNIEDIIKVYYEEGLVAVAHKYCISKSYVSKTLKKLGYISAEKKKREEILFLLKENAHNMLLEDFAKMFGYPRSTVGDIASKNNIIFLNKSDSHNNLGKIIELSKTKVVSEIAEELSINKQTLRNYLKRNNISYHETIKDIYPGHVVYAYYDRDGIVRYYGEGATVERAFSFTGHRTKGYLKYFSDYYPTVKVLHCGLSKERALELEQQLIDDNLTTDKTVYNHRIGSRRKKDIDYSTINSILYYDETSPTFLRWKESDKYGNRVKDAIAGHFCKASKYYSIHLSKIGTIRCHVIVWLLHNGKIDTNMCIDHINGNRSDNRILNLREISPSDNNKNRTSRSNTGYKNLYWNDKSLWYQLYWNDNGSRVTAQYKVSVYGSKENALSAALAAREIKIKEGLILVRENEK